MKARAIAGLSVPLGAVPSAAPAGAGPAVTSDVGSSLREQVFPRARTSVTTRLLDGLDLVVEFATLGEYRLPGRSADPEHCEHGEHRRTVGLAAGDSLSRAAEPHGIGGSRPCSGLRRRAGALPSRSLAR